VTILQGRRPEGNGAEPVWSFFPRFRFFQGNVAVRTGDLKKTHRISRETEPLVRRWIPRREEVMIQCEPQACDYLRVSVPQGDRTGDGQDKYTNHPIYGLFVLKYKKY